MKKTSDVELLKIITIDRDNYQKDAVIAAEAELATRNLSTEQVNNAKLFNEEQQQIQLANANTPLDGHWKVLTFIFPGLLQIILSGTFKSSGYDRKASELVKWTLYGFGFYLAILLIALAVS